MNKRADRGMTLLEVVVAFTILFIVIGFIMQSDAVAQRFSYKSQLRQQMIFYAAGLLEAQIEGVDPSSDPSLQNLAPFNSFESMISSTPVPGNPFLEQVEVKVYLANSPTDPEPVSLFIYRVKHDEKQQ